MLRLLCSFFLSAVVFATMASADSHIDYQDQAPGYENFEGTGDWRSIAPHHYYSGKCCFCREATNVRPGLKEGYSEYEVEGRWWPFPHMEPTNPDLNRLPEFVMICDAQTLKWACIIHGYGT